jgi:F-type H+-transporting ATPase subunit epsilon
MTPFPFELVSPERLLFSGAVEQVIVPGAEGEFTVLKDHAPLMALMKPGIVTVVESGARTQKLFVRGGFADVSPAGLTILAEEAIPVEQVDAAKIDAEIKDLEEDYADASSEVVKAGALEKLGQLREVKAVLGL